jgi:hypothetical protein
MPIPVLAGAAAVAAIIVPLVVKVLVAIGVGFATYTGVSAALGAARTYLEARFADLPVEVLALLGIMNVDKFVTMILSAYAVRLVLMGLTASGALNRFQVKGVGAG